MSFKEPIPALSNVMDTNEHASSMACVVHTKDVAIGFNISGYRGLELRGPGAVAHMSLHQKSTMSKSHPTKQADKKCSPTEWTGGHLSVLSWRPMRTSQEKPGGAASVSGHIWAALSRVNAFLQFYFASAETPQSRGFGRVPATNHT
jgi:hypothetical protein